MKIDYDHVPSGQEVREYIARQNKIANEKREAEYQRQKAYWENPKRAWKIKLMPWYAIGRAVFEHTLPLYFIGLVFALFVKDNISTMLLWTGYYAYNLRCGMIHLDYTSFAAERSRRYREAVHANLGKK